jgi:hypothetical protein
MSALKNPQHERFAVEVAGGNSLRQAWVTAGFGEGSRNWARLARRKNVERRIEELRVELNTQAAVHLRHIQNRLLSFITADVTMYFERSEGGSLKIRRDLLDMPPELRGAISELRIDKDGKVVLKLEDKARAVAELLRTMPNGIASTKTELFGPGGGPVQLQAAQPPKTPIEVALALRALIDQAAAESGACIADANATLVERAKALMTSGEPLAPTMYSALLAAATGDPVAKDEPTE